MRSLILTLIVLTGCAAMPHAPVMVYSPEHCNVRLTNWDNARQTSNKYGPDAVGMYYNIFVYKWVEIFSDLDPEGYGGIIEVVTAMDETNIYWQRGDVFTRPNESERLEGLAYPDGNIFLAERGKLSDTALAHELVHVALLAVNGDPDRDHLGDEHKGWNWMHENLIFEVSLAYARALESPLRFREGVDVR